MPRSFYEGDAREVAPRLLNKILAHRGRAGRIVEVEAYCGAEDAASHGYRGETERNQVMFGPAGHLYVYFTYGMHFCANAVCGAPGVSAAVLIRALAPVEGLAEMQDARPKARRRRDLCSGPAKLCQALGLDRRHDGADLVRGDLDVVMFDDGVPPPPAPGQSPRIGISKATEVEWRWFVDGDPNVSKVGSGR